MKARQPLNPSTLHQRAYRERMREAGLVKKDVWIRPEHADALAGIEKRMRDHMPAGSVALHAATAPAEALATPWTLAAIAEALAASPAVHAGHITLETLDDGALHLTMHDHGGLSVFLAVGGEQIVAEAYLWPVCHVADPAAFNAHVLATHKLLPLTSVGIGNIGGMAGYTMFGSLDARSSLTSLLLEIHALADNVLEASQAWLPYLKPQHRLAEPDA